MRETEKLVHFTILHVQELKIYGRNMERIKHVCHKLTLKMWPRTYVENLSDPRVESTASILINV